MTSQPFLPCPLPRRKTGEDRMRWRAALSRACLLALLCGCGTIAGQAMAQTARQATAAAFDLGAVIEEKIAYNATRGHRHGGKSL